MNTAIGIEYGLMQLIAEAYHILKYAAYLSNDEIAKVFQMYLVEIFDIIYILRYLLNGMKGIYRVTCLK